MDIKKSLYLVDKMLTNNLSSSYVAFKEEFRNKGNVYKFKNSVNLLIKLNKEALTIEAIMKYKNNIFIISYPLVPDGSNFLYLDTSFNKEDYLSKLKDYFVELDDSFLSDVINTLFNFVNYILNSTSEKYKSLFGLEVFNALRISLVACGDNIDEFGITNSLNEFYTDERAIRTEGVSIEDFLSEEYSAHDSVLYSLMYTSFKSTCVINLLKEGRYFIGSLTPYELYLLLPMIYDSYVKGSIPFTELLSDLRSGYPKDITDMESWEKYEKN